VYVYVWRGEKSEEKQRAGVKVTMTQMESQSQKTRDKRRIEGNVFDKLKKITPSAPS